MKIGHSEARVTKLFAVAFALVTVVLALNAGRADHLPYMRPDGAVVSGDWGLHRPGWVVPWIIGPAVIGSPPLGTAGYFFPTNRDDPGAYRRRSPEKSGPPPEPYFRWWGAESQPPHPSTATEYAPFEPPAVIYAPRDAHKSK
jgi:hypothetical protein